MPFVQRVVTPKYVARSTKPSHSRGATPLPVQDYELEAITNLTLSNALRQLASLVLISNQIFTELNKELASVSERSLGIKQRIDNLSKRVEEFDPKQVTVPESDLVSFALIKNHYSTKYTIETSLFTAETRSETLQELYDAAARTPVPAIAEMDRLAGYSANERRGSDAFLCTPVLGLARRKLKSTIDMEIETRLPSAIEDLRKWTSTEAIGDTTVPPDCTVRVLGNSSSTAGIFGHVSTHNTSPTYHQAGTSTASFDETDDIIIVEGNSSRGLLGTRDQGVPLDHRLPSPEEQCQMIALKFPAETIKVDTSGRRFDRMCTTRKSLLHFAPTSERAETSGDTAGGTNQQIDGADGDTIRRRSRPRRSRGKRRNTIATTDQKEFAEVVNNGDEAITSSAISTNLVPRSKSSDILKKESPSSASSSSATTMDISSKHQSSFSKLSHFNSLKQWGRNRLRMINNRDSREKVQDIDDFNIYDTTRNSKRKSSDKEVKLSHERKPSYSSSERSITVASNTGISASINPVKLRESSSIRRQRRTALGNKDEPHSSSGNWSASSESGRTSIGSEITTTTQPKSSASSSSLNHNHHTISSGPPSSIISRRRFLNTSASSSVTSEGTATPDLQMYDYHDEGGETSSVYSCDTEGYYTSFHVDSGLKTLKEEEPATPMHSSTALSSTTSFESSGNQTVISPENEYELFGRGSTSTTTSSAGTICTVLADGQRNSINGPAVPERKSSLTKLNRSNSTASNGTLERSYSSSTVGSTLERTGTIKRNGQLLQKEVAALIHQEEEAKKTRIESPDSGNNTSSSPIESNENSSPTQRVRSCSEFEYSESSDLECVDRIERIREKTTINTSRIPSMCIITPTNSDDENGSLKRKKEKSTDTPHNESVDSKRDSSFKKNTLIPLNNMFGRLRGVLKKSPSKDSNMTENVNNEPIYDVTGEYVRIAEVKSAKKGPARGGVYYSNDVVKRNLATVLSGKLNDETEYVSLNELPCNIRCESNLLSNSQKTPDGSGKANTSSAEGETEENKGENAECANKRGARVKLDAHGKVIYSSDSLKRRKGAHTTFAPGPFVKDVNTPSSTGDSGVAVVSVSNNIPHSSSTNVPAVAASAEEISKNVAASPLLSGGLANRKPIVVKPVISQSALKTKAITIGKSKPSGLRMAPIATILPNISSISQQQKVNSSQQPQQQPIMSSGILKGAYVNVQDATNKPQIAIDHQSARYLKPQQSDYQHSSPEGYDGYYGEQQHHAYTLPRRPPSTSTFGQAAPPAQAMPPARPPYPVGYVANTNPFQRSNDMYWTLQTRRRPTPMGSAIVRDDSKVLLPNGRPMEELYSTPNKLRTNELKTTPTGFANYFSPIAKTNTGIELIDDVDSSLKISPIDPRNTAAFKTSTPSKPVEECSSPTRNMLSEELRHKLRLQHAGIRSHGNSPVNSGRSTPKNVLEAQPPRGRHSWASNSTDIPQTCSDRLGTPKTSLMDFKKLLLAHGSKTNLTTGGKISAVELLKKSKSNQPPAQSVAPSSKPSVNNSNLSILDLSGSPKTFATRRMIRQGNFGNGSPSKIGSGSKLASRGGWRYANMRSEVMSTSIPEANSEEDNSSPNTSASASRSQSQSRNCTPTASTHEVNDLSPTEERTTNENVNVTEEKISNIRENIFLQEDENNFMKGEVSSKPFVPATTRAQLQAQRAQFLNNNNHIKSATFRDGHYMGISNFGRNLQTTSTSPKLINEVNYGNDSVKHERHSPKPTETAL
ncbi:uncharacterized protein LOC129739372 [Uranotaenia lowii]|uniref:uncharacterized protein LOC129739372 n=1 Tax=Uranotaenia lowii TaxID=190385 RepID=UPI002478938A|nr:uncharacterized protein LOC129739372 [Uranotaenia lowii]